MTDPWTVGTYAGARAAQARDQAALSPQQRWEWLEAALELAIAGGALQADRARRQQEVDDLWAQPPRSARASPSSR